MHRFLRRPLLMFLPGAEERVEHMIKRYAPYILSVLVLQLTSFPGDKATGSTHPSEHGNPSGKKTTKTKAAAAPSAANTRANTG